VEKSYILCAIALVLSFAFWITTICVNPVKKGRFTGRKKIILVSGLLVFTIWLLRMAAEFTVSTGFEVVIACLIDTLQTFSMDAEYREFIQATQGIINSIPKMPAQIATILNLYIPIIYVAAPITGGAVLFEIIASIFPRVKLFFAKLSFWKEIVYFSELNESSLALAKSIRENVKGNRFSRPILVFTDVYTDEDEEKSTELLLSAKVLGAICINDDILHTHLRHKFKKKIFLIDENEINNIQTLTALSTDDRCEILDGCDVFLFSHDDTFSLVGYKIKDDLNNKMWKRKKPRIISVNGYRNLVRNLLSEIPLYEPLIGKVDLQNESYKEKKYDLNITIMGAGDIGTEMFLSTYWYGQILNCQLNINVISQETEEDFIDKINYINPDIFDSCKRIKRKDTSNDIDKAFCFDGTTERFKKIMRKYRSKEGSAEPYFNFRYYQTNIKDDDLETKLTNKYWDDDFSLIESDYFAITLGSDADNLAVADKLSRFVSIAKLNATEKKNAVIAYVVYDVDLCKVLNEQKQANVLETGIYMKAFGSLDEVYDTKNIYMEEKEGEVEKISDAYEKATQSVVNTKYYKKNYSQYEYWSDIARALHIKYKVFSAGKIEKSLFNSSYDDRKKHLEEALNKYKSTIIPSVKDNNDDRMKKINNTVYGGLTWLEHRRWNAFMRINGFRCPEDFTVYSSQTGQHKNIELKLHPCLVESNTDGRINEIFSNMSYDDLDELDRISVDVYKALDKQTNYKLYDCPGFDFNCNEVGELEE